MALSRFERLKQYDDARAMISLLRDRVDAERSRPGRSTLPNLEKAMLDLKPTLDASHYAVPSPRMQWILTVGCILNGLGREAAYILMARLGRRQKSQENSWPRILGEMEQLGIFKTEQEAKAILRNAVPCFLLSLEANDVTRDYRDAIAA